MEKPESNKSRLILFVNTFAFTICFAAWMLNGVLVTFLASNQVFDWGPVEIGWLLGIPVLAGSILRIPAGILTDKYGGKPVYVVLLLLCSIPMFLLSTADSFFLFALYSFGFGIAGASFAIGISYTSVWYPKDKRGSVIGIFGAGNAGAAVTLLIAPTLLNKLTNEGADIEGWRFLPIIYGIALLITGLIFLLFTKNKKPVSTGKKIGKILSPLKDIRVWRFGLYYFLVFGCFVAFSQWLMPYFVNVYFLPIVTAGILVALFSLPSGLLRAYGGRISELLGARKMMYMVLGISVVICALLFLPKMEITSPGKSVNSKNDGVVTFVSNTLIKINDIEYSLESGKNRFENADEKNFIFPVKDFWQEPVVRVGEQVMKKQLIGKGITKIYFQANIWVFTILVILLGSIWGMGKASIYKNIPDYFSEDVGLVGGMVSVLGGLGGFIFPIVFGYLLEGTGLWTSSWMFVFLLSAICLLWMHRVVIKMTKEHAPEIATEIESTYWNKLIK